MFDGLAPRRCEDVKGIATPEIGPKSFGTFEKRALDPRPERSMRVGHSRYQSFVDEISGWVCASFVCLCFPLATSKIIPCYAPIKSKLQHPRTQGKPRAFELLKIGLFESPYPGQNGVQMAYPIVGFVCQMPPPPLKNNCRRLLLSLIKPVYIRGTRRR